MKGGAQTFEVTHELFRNKYRFSNNIYHTRELVQTAPFRITALSRLTRWKPIARPSRAIALDTSLVNDINHAWLAMLTTSRTRCTITFSIGCKMPIARLAFAIGPITCFAYNIHHSGQLMVAATHGSASLAISSGKAVARNCRTTFWPVMLASLILPHLTNYPNHQTFHYQTISFAQRRRRRRRKLLRCDGLLRGHSGISVKKCCSRGIAPSLLRTNGGLKGLVVMVLSWKEL